VWLPGALAGSRLSFAFSSSNRRGGFATFKIVTIRCLLGLLSFRFFMDSTGQGRLRALR
jgi:hypothetical protein